MAAPGIEQGPVFRCIYVQPRPERASAGWRPRVTLRVCGVSTNGQENRRSRRHLDENCQLPSGSQQAGVQRRDRAGFHT